MFSRFLTVFSLISLLLLSACANQQQQHQAPVELKGDTFYGFDSNAAAGSGGEVHVVKPRESLSILAKRYHVSVGTIARANHLKAPYIIKVGQKLHIPTKTAPLTKGRALAKLDNGTYQSVPVPSITSSKIAPPSKDEQKITIVKKQDVMVQAPTSSPATPLSSAKPTTAEPAAAPLAPPAAISSNAPFIWPVKGQLLLHFGPGKGGYFNDGINISAPEGTPISASANGKVVYAGNELRGYGNLVIMRHDNGLLTAYAHQKDMLVKKGDSVAKGQAIGHVGSTGNVSSPQLHFGIRNGKNALNPEEYLPKG